MDFMTFFGENINISITVLCLCIGYIVKNCTPIKNNLVIPINALIGVVIAVWAGGWAFSLPILTQGLCSGLAATGLYEAFKNYVENYGNG